jgi:hypothetical protein
MINNVCDLQDSKLWVVCHSIDPSQLNVIHRHPLLLIEAEPSAESDARVPV